MDNQPVLGQGHMDAESAQLGRKGGAAHLATDPKATAKWASKGVNDSLNWGAELATGMIPIVGEAKIGKVAVAAEVAQESYVMGEAVESLPGARIVTFGKNYLVKFKKHAEQIRRVTGVIFGKLKNPETIKQVQDLMQEIVTKGELREMRYMSYPKALWSRYNGSIIIRKLDGEFVTYLDESLGGQAANWK